jgi:hypothetical protein
MAITDIGRAIQLDGGVAAYYESMADTYDKAGDRPRANEYREKARKLSK